MNQTNIQTSFNRKLESRIRLSRSKQLAKNRHLVLTNINDSKKADVQSNVKSSMKSTATMQTTQKIIVIIAELPPQRPRNLDYFGNGSLDKYRRKPTSNK